MKKKDIILLLIIIFLLLFFILLSGLVYNTLQTYQLSNSFLQSELKIQQDNSETVFSIDKITYFSSADADIQTNSNSSFTISNLFQYTDIAIFINPNSDNLTNKNTLKSVKLGNISYSLKPNIGTQNLYYKNLNEFATSKFSNSNIVSESITFDTTSEDLADFSKPILYNNCANPITLCYVNSKIQDNFTLENNISNISHNGSLLKICGITLNSISCNINCTVEIINNLDELYTCPITLDIPLSTESQTVYGGSLTLKDNLNYKFIKRGRFFIVRDGSLLKICIFIFSTKKNRP